MLPTHAVGIDLGTTYSCIAYLNEHGEPVTIPNRDGELSTPSVVMFDGDQVIVGSEALRNSIRAPERVIQHAKRHMGDAQHRWVIGGRSFTPVDVSSHILKQLLADAKQRIGVVERAVITVPAQFSDRQRQSTIEAGRLAGLKQIDIINEPVAAALCFVLGTEGLWFAELANAQTLLVADLGGGTFDLSLVKYDQNSVHVIGSGGDLNLGGIDWNSRLETAISRQFLKDFGVDVAQDRESRQALSLEVEQAKRSLSVRPKAALTCQHAGRRKTYQVELAQFERLTQPLVERMRNVTANLLRERQMGWARVDVVLTTGGASRMPMVRGLLKEMSGRTLNTTLSPDQSIAHGATYFAGMLLTKADKAAALIGDSAAARLRAFDHRSASARALGILVRDERSGQRVPHYLLPAHSRLPAEAKQIVGTVMPNQRRAHLHIIESGTDASPQFAELGTCLVDPLPQNLPENSEIEVTIRYDEQARVSVSAKVLATGEEAHAEIARPENLVAAAPAAAAPASETANPKPPPVPKPPSLSDSTDQPVPLCSKCGEVLTAAGKCLKCDRVRRPKPAAATAGPTAANGSPPRRADDEVLDLGGSRKPPAPPEPIRASATTTKPPGKPEKPKGDSPPELGEEDFFRLAEE